MKANVCGKYEFKTNKYGTYFVFEPWYQVASTLKISEYPHFSCHYRDEAQARKGLASMMRDFRRHLAPHRDWSHVYGADENPFLTN